MTSLKATLEGIQKGTFPTRGDLNAARNETHHSFYLLLNAYHQFLLLHSLDDAQSRSVRQFLQVFSPWLNYAEHAQFINLTIIRVNFVALQGIVQIVSSKQRNRIAPFLKAIGLLAEVRQGSYKDIEAMILYTFELFKEDQDQKLAVDFLSNTLDPRDFLTAMIFCRDKISNQNYVDLCCWFAIRNETFISSSSIGDLMLILPRLNLSTIRDINIISDLSKHLRAFQREIDRAGNMIQTVEGVMRKRLEFLSKHITRELPDDSTDLIDFYQNYKYGVK